VIDGFRSATFVNQPPLQRASPARIPVLCLAGFMGSGKTTVGTLLGRQLAWRFVDLDDRIEEAARMRISEFFERFGEPAFRALEAEQLRSVLGRAVENKESLVLALGGGTYAQAGAPEFLRAQGIPVVWLDSPIETLLARCMTMTGRPLFRDEASFRALFTQRLPSYQLADFRVNSSGSPSQVVTEILRLAVLPAGGEGHLVVEKPRP
jgi:shikimate kinase